MVTHRVSGGCGVFETIVGQENVTRTLASIAASGRVPHAFLFVGPYGVGKTETALEFARRLLCDEGPVSECSDCASCRRARNLEHPDLHVLFPFTAPPEKADKYADWVDALREHRRTLADESYAPIIYEKGRQIVVRLVDEVYDRLMESAHEGGRKVCVILLAERLNDKTGAMLLKILEEPPEGVHFILTAEKLSDVLPTIVSRSSVLRFSRLVRDDVEGYLAAHGLDDPEMRKSVATEADGSLKTAIKLAADGVADTRSQAREVFMRVAKGSADDVIIEAARFADIRDVAELEEYLYGFAVETRNELGRMLDDGGGSADPVRVRAIDKLTASFESGVDMLARNVNGTLVLTTILHDIYDTFGQTDRQPRR